jgi:hypothetical protein
MKTYIAHFRTDADFATREFKARTPHQALALACEFFDNDPLDLTFASYDGVMPVNEIVIKDADGNERAAWRDDDMRLRRAAPELLEAAEAVVACWERGDLAAAVRDLEAAIARAKGGAR